MPKYNILVVEDEPLIAQDLILSLTQSGFNSIGPFDNAIEAFEAAKASSPSIALIDINIKGDKDGIDLAMALNNRFPVIFVTSYYDEATLKRVEKTKPYAYILKPFREEEILMNVRLALSKFKQVQANYEDTKVLVRSATKSTVINQSDIAIVKGEDNYAKIILTNKTELLVSQTLKLFQEKLNPKKFFRIHKSYVVNTDLMEGVSSNKVLILGDSLPIGRTYKVNFMKSFQIS